MPQPDRLLTTIERAIDAVRRQPGRRGRFVQLDGVTDVLVAGDLHGNVGNFQAIYKIADLANNPGRHLILQEVVHGKFRYPLGGDKSHQLLDLFSALKNQYPTRVHLLMGNHEVGQWTGRQIMKSEEDLNTLFEQGVKEAYGSHAAEIMKAYGRLFSTLPFAIRTPNRVFFSHSLPTSKNLGQFQLDALTSDNHPPEAYAPKGQLYSLVWGRDVSQENAAAFLNLVDADWLVTGHIPCEHGFATPNERQIILDSCASPAAYAIIPADRALTRNDFYKTVYLL